jgi:sterol desaturase/sphingolipid hydroxylase (fatty acid hydroxylase superfamily)
MSAPVSLEIFLGFLMFALVFAPLERRFPLRRQGAFRPGWRTDVAYYVAGCFVGRLSDTTSLGAMLLIRHATKLDFASVAATQPGWIQFLEILIIADFLAYLFHRALHRRACLWRLHRVHHSSQRMDWLANVRLHPIDKLLGDCFQFIPLFFLGFATAPLLAYTIFLGFQGFLNHSNIKLNYGPLRWLIASPEFHHWHHGSDPKAHDRNFSPHLVIFDLLFGTAYLPPDGSLPEEYGIPDAVPEGFLAQMIYPFRSIGPTTTDPDGAADPPAPGVGGSKHRRNRLSAWKHAGGRSRRN